MKIVVLDGHTTNPGDLDWSPLFALGEVEILPRTPASEVAAKIRDAEIVLTNKAVVDADSIAAASKLRYISVLATGTNIVDIPAAKAKGIQVSNVPGYSTDSVAQLTFALLLELTHRTGEHSASVHAGGWVSSPDFSYTLGPLIELSGRTLGVLGMGAIGRKVAQIGRAFGMEILTVDRPSTRALGDVRLVPLEDLLAHSDVLTLHTPLTPDTKGLVSAERLSKMKPTGYLLNTSRGGLIVEADLAEALNEGRIAGAGLDVLSTEPPSPDNPLLTARNCVITPHVAWETVEARKRLLNQTVRNVQAFLDGTPRNLV